MVLLAACPNADAPKPGDIGGPCLPSGACNGSLLRCEWELHPFGPGEYLCGLNPYPPPALKGDKP